MSKTISIVFLMLSTLIMSGQELGFSVNRLQAKSIVKSNISLAKTIKDLNPGYPSSWINNYVSVELMTTYNGIVSKAISPNDILNKEQHDILELATTGTLVDVIATYTSDSDYKVNKDEPKVIKFSITVVPAIEARYKGGDELMNDYLKETVLSKVKKSNSEEPEVAEVAFTIDEQGKASNVQITEPSINDEFDKFLIKAIRDMPQWNPAQNSEGHKIKQEFRFRIGKGIGC